MKNPLEYIRYFFKKKTEELDENKTYTKEEVEEIIKDLQKSVYTSIKNSRFIFDVNDDPVLGFDFSGPSFTKLIVDENKYLLFVRCSNELLQNRDFIESIKAYKDKYEYISDIVFVDYDTNISLVTAKMSINFDPFKEEDEDTGYKQWVRLGNYRSDYDNSLVYDYVSAVPYVTSNYTISYKTTSGTSSVY